jgi:hypothetical protein
MGIITQTKNLASPVRYVPIKYHKASNRASKKINVNYYTAIFTSVNKKLDHYLNVCYNSQNQSPDFVQD